MSIGAVPNKLQQKFDLNSRKVFNVMLFKELVKQIAVILEAK